MKWVAECNACKFKDSSNNRHALKQRAMAHKQQSGHRVFITGQLALKEVEQCQSIGKTFLAAVGVRL